MKWLDSLLEEYKSERKKHKSESLLKIPMYIKRVLISDRSRADEYRRLAQRDFEFSKMSLALVDSKTSAINTEKIKDGLSYLTIHLSTLKERESFIVVYGAFLVSLIAIYELLGDTPFVIAILLFGGVLIAERIHLNTKKSTLEELKSILERTLEKRETLDR